MKREYKVSEQTGKALDCFVDCDRLHGRILDLSREFIGEHEEIEDALCDAICKVEKLVMKIIHDSIENKISEIGNDGAKMIV